MRKALFAILPLLLFLLLSGKLDAQSIDPTLAAMIALYTEKAENTLKSQEEAMLLESTGHVWIKEEVDGTWQIQKEFNDYLDTFRGIIVYAAQIYGFYHEIDKMVGNMGKLNDQIAKSPGNAVAVALSANRNKVYGEGTDRGVLRCPSQAQGDEQDASAAHQGREVHVPNGRME